MFSNYLSSIKILYFDLTVAEICSKSSRSQQWFKWWLGAENVISHYLKQWWINLAIHISLTWPQWVKHHSHYEHKGDKNISTILPLQKVTFIISNGINCLIFVKCSFVTSDEIYNCEFKMFFVIRTNGVAYLIVKILMALCLRGYKYFSIFWKSCFHQI